MKGYVLPTDTTQAGHVIEWGAPGELLPLLYREIGTDCVDHGTVVLPGGELTIWVDDTGLTVPHPDYNDHALGIARGGGWNAVAIAGTVVITGGCDRFGNTLGLSEMLLCRIDATIRVVRGLARDGES